MNKPVKVSHSRRLFESVVSDGTSTKTTHRVTESSNPDGLILRTQQLYSKILDQDYSANQLEDILEYHDFYRIHELDPRDKDEMEDAIWLHANHVQSHQLEELYNELNEYYNDLSKGLGNRWSTKRSNESRSKRRKSHKVNESSSRMHVEDMNNFIRVYPWYDVQTNDFIEIDYQGRVLVEGQVDIPTVEHALRVARKKGYKFSIVSESINNDSKVVKLKNIIDTWNVIEKYQVKGWTQKDYNSSIFIPLEEFKRLLSSAKNRNYILNLIQK